MNTVLQELRYATRMLRRSPAFTAVAVAVLAIGIGANTAVFSAINGVLFHPLPYEEPDRAAMLWSDDTARGGNARVPVSPGDFFDWREQSSSFSGLAALRNESWALTGLDKPVVPLLHLVPPNYFDVLGVEPFLGRSSCPTKAPPATRPQRILVPVGWRLLTLPFLFRQAFPFRSLSSPDGAALLGGETRWIFVVVLGQAPSQALQGDLAVAGLGAGVGRRDDETRGEVPEPHGRVGAVAVLPAGSGRLVDGYLDLVFELLGCG